VEKLGALINIETDQRDSDEFMIHTNGSILVQGRASREFGLETGIDTEGFSGCLEGFRRERVFSVGASRSATLREGTFGSRIQSLDSWQSFHGPGQRRTRARYVLNVVHEAIFHRGSFPFETNVAEKYDRNGKGSTTPHTSSARYTGAINSRPGPR
jgi:flagellar hook-associated protein 1 FlgK